MPESFGDAVQGGEADIDFAAFDAADGAGGEAGCLGQVLLEPAFAFTQGADAVADLLFKPGHK